MSAGNKESAAVSRAPKRPSNPKTLVACDCCLRLQLRCTFNPATQEKCRSCIVRNTECTWSSAPKPRPLPDSAYIDYLENRAKKMEVQLKQMFPGINIKREIDTLLGPDSNSPEPILPSSGAAPQQPNADSPPASKPSAGTPKASEIVNTPAVSRLVQQVLLANIRSDSVPVDASDDDKVVWGVTEDEPRYHGLSSSEVLSRDANMFRNGYHSDSFLSSVPTRYRRPEFWRPTNAELRQVAVNPWETEAGLALDLPPDDLLTLLVDVFFENTIIPILHRPSFEKQLKEGLHKRNGSFLRIVLLVCANGARWCDDPRVLDDRWPVPLSAGHRWFRQLDAWHKFYVDHISLYDAQLLVLVAMFLFGSSASYGTWMVVGIALRKMQDVGAHRKKQSRSLEDELFKRCFWAMLFLDRLQSMSFGRQGAIQDVDIDIDDLLEVDDELWSLDPHAPPPKQPQGIPSKLSMFKHLSGLTRIVGRCLQTLFALERTKHQIGLDTPQGSAWMFNDINMQLDLWAGEVPPHLQPSLTGLSDNRFVSQTVALWAVYYDLVIAANQTFISRQFTPLTTPAIRLSRNAARSCANLLDIHRRICGPRRLPNLCYPAFSSAMNLVVDLIAERRVKQMDSPLHAGHESPFDENYTIEQREEDLRKCMRILEDGETHFHIAGRLHDMVREFEESWRLQISPNARPEPLVRPVGRPDAPTQPNDPMHGPGSEDQLPFKPSDSVLPPLCGEKSTPLIDAGVHPSFDIAHHPPITTPTLRSPSQPHSSQPASTNDSDPPQDYDYAHHAAYADQMFLGLIPPVSASDSTVPNRQADPAIPEVQTVSSRQGLGSQMPFSNSVLGGLQPYIPEYGYTPENAYVQHLLRRTSAVQQRPPRTNIQTADAMGTHNRAKAAAELGGFLSGTWISAFSDPTGIPNNPERTSQWAEVGTNTPETTGPMAQWDVLMQNSLNLYGYQPHK